MAILLKALILVDTDDVAEAQSAVRAVLDQSVCDPTTLLVDHALGVQRMASIDDDYIRGSLARSTRDLAMMQTANRMDKPC